MTLRVQHFPADMSLFAVPNKDFDRCFVCGLFEENVEAGGQTRPFYTYIAAGLPYDSPCIVIAPPDDADPVEFLTASGLKEFADRERVFLHLLPPQGGAGNFDGSDADALNMVYARVQSRDFYVTMQDNIYLFGFGRGATAAVQAAMKESQWWSGLGTIGALDGAAMLNAVPEPGEEKRTINLTGEMILQSGRGPLPVWMAFPRKGENEAAVVEYWKTQNGAAPERFSGDDLTELYLPDMQHAGFQINEEHIAQVRVTVSPNASSFDLPLFERLWQYVSTARRHRGPGKRLLRVFKRAGALGATRHEIEHQGFMRLWYEYVPPCLRGRSEPTPLVVCMHGRGGNAESFLDISGMTAVAEERGFIVAFPQSSVYQQKPPHGLRNVTLWNAGKCRPDMDNAGFIRAMAADIAGRHALDMGRVYCCGQSSGGRMSCELAWYASDLFVAAAPWSSVEPPDPARGITSPAVPLFIMRGELDQLKNRASDGRWPFTTDATYRTVFDYAARRLGVDEQPLRWRTGRYEFFEFRTAAGVPMLTYCDVKDMPHGNIPEMSWLTWDLFFSRFERRDGRLLYMGRPV